MNTHHYQEYNKDSFDAMYKKLVNAGDPDATVTMNGKMTITTKLSKTEVDVMFDDLMHGSLDMLKDEKSKEISDKSVELTAQGIATWNSDEYIELTEAETDKRSVALTYYKDNPEELTQSTPYLMITLSGGLVTTYDINDIIELVDRMKHRLDYIYSSAVGNSDGSNSELLLKYTISQAESEAQLNTITDTRV